MKFLFDLDGTVTSKETLPIISEHFGCTEQNAELTMRTDAGNIHSGTQPDTSKIAWIYLRDFSDLIVFLRKSKSVQLFVCALFGM